MHAIGWKPIWCSILIYVHSCFHHLFMKHLNVLLILLHWKSCENRKQRGINIRMILQSCSQPIVLLLLWTCQKILFRKHAINAIVEGLLRNGLLLQICKAKRIEVSLRLKKGCLWLVRKFKKLKWIFKTFCKELKKNLFNPGLESIIEETNDVQCIDAVTKIAINSASSLSQRNVSGLMTSQNPELPEIKSLQ